MKGFALAMQCVAFWILVQGLGNNVVAAGYQRSCTDVQIDLQNVLEQVKLIEQKSPRFNEAEIERIKELLQAATDNPQCIFNSLSDSEAFSLVKALCRLEAYFRDKSSSEQIFLWESFLKQYPRSLHLDEARWLRAKTAATPYEYEGHADAALKQIESIEVFIKENPSNSYLPEAELELARACRIAYETFRYGNGLSATSNEDRQGAGRKYRDRAGQLLKRLCDQSSDPARLQACQALHDLAEGRCVYMGPGSPNPHFPDNWEMSKPK
jgi:hypothetical protein